MFNDTNVLNRSICCLGAPMHAKHGIVFRRAAEYEDGKMCKQIQLIHRYRTRKHNKRQDLSCINACYTLQWGRYIGSFSNARDKVYMMSHRGSVGLQHDARLPQHDPDQASMKSTNARLINLCLSEAVPLAAYIRIHRGVGNYSRNHRASMRSRTSISQARQNA